MEVGDKLELDTNVYFGMSAADIDEDGDEDLLIGQHQRAQPLIAFNNGFGVLEVPDRNIFQKLERDRHVGNLVDFDNDGDQDIYYGSGQGRPHELWRNSGSGTEFVDLWLDLDPPPITGNARSTVWFDWDRDGFLDVFMIVGRTTTHSEFATNSSGTGGFVVRTEEVGLFNFPLGSNGGCGLSDFDRDGDMDLFLCNPSEDVFIPGEADGRGRFYRQNDDGTFTDMLDELLGESAKWWTTAARGGDYDNDGDLDLFVGKGMFNRDYAEEFGGDGVNLPETGKLEFFSRVSLSEGDREDGFSVAVKGAETITVDLVSFRAFVPEPDPSTVFLGVGRVNPDAVPFEVSLSDPLILGEPSPNFAGLYFWYDVDAGRLHCLHKVLALDTTQFATGFVTVDGTLADVVVTDMERNVNDTTDQLFRNNGDGTFTNVTDQMGIDNEMYTVTAGWFDFDNDADLDLLIINAHYDVPQSRPFRIYRNDGEVGFVDVAETAGFHPDLNAILTSVAFADFNADGFIDFALSYDGGPPPRNNGRPKYYVNRGNANRWLQIALVGTVSNRDGIGAKLRLTTENSTQHREQTGGFHAFGQDTKIIHFGVADAEFADLTIEWPSGITQTLTDVPTNQRITAVEPESN